MLRNYISRYKTILAKNYFIKSFLILVSSSAAAQAINFLFYPAISRIYSPADFGVLAAFTSVIGICSSFTSGQYELAIPTVKTNVEAKQLVKVAVFVSCIFAFAFAILLLLLRLFFSNSFGGFFNKDILWLIPLSIILLNGYTIFTVYYVKYGKLKLIFRTRIYQVLSKNFLQVIGGLFSANKVVFLVLGLITSQSTGLFSFVKDFVSRDNKKPRKSLSWIFHKEKRHFLHYITKYKKYPIYLIPSGILNKGGLELPVLFFSVYYGAKFTGYYSMANQIVLIPIGVIMQSLSRSYLNEFSTRYIESKAGALGFYKNFNFKVIKWTLIPCIAFCLIIKPFAIFFLGPKWINSAEMMQYFVAFGYFQLIYSTISQTLNVIGKHSLQLKWNIYRTMVVLLTLYICYITKTDEFVVFKIYILVMILFYIILGQITVFALKKDVRNDV